MIIKAKLAAIGAIGGALPAVAEAALAVELPWSGILTGLFTLLLTAVFALAARAWSASETERRADRGAIEKIQADVLGLREDLHLMSDTLRDEARKDRHDIRNLVQGDHLRLALIEQQLKIHVAAVEKEKAS